MERVGGEIRGIVLEKGGRGASSVMGEKERVLGF